MTKYGYLDFMIFLAHYLASGVRWSYVINFHILIFSSETTGPIATKRWWNGPWMAPLAYTKAAMDN
jgi:hypothetical protein